jgi:hypothetical protein
MKSQDILILLGILTWKGPKVTYERLSEAMGVSKTPTVHAVKRLVEARLYHEYFGKVNIPATKEFLIHGVKYVFPHPNIEENASEVLGFATGISHPVFEGKINFPKKFVWPSAKGNEKGIPIKPLYDSIPDHCFTNIELMELLALIEVLRIGRIREVEFTEKLLLEKLSAYEK